MPKVIELVDHRAVYERDGWRCGICRGRVDRRRRYPDPMSASLDHIVPLAEGGQHVLANVQCAHLQCNSTKGERALWGGEQLRLIG